MARILVVGSIADDGVIRLTEALRPGAHLNGASAGVRLGGGGANTAVALAAAGHDVALLAAVGCDAVGDALLADLAAAGVDTSLVTRLNQSTTRSLLLIDPTGDGDATMLLAAKNQRRRCGCWACLLMRITSVAVAAI